MITLYKYQKKIVKSIVKQMKKGDKHILVQSPTGSGKTIMFSFIAKKVSEKNNKVLIITDRTELLLQAGGTINKFEMNPYYIKAGTKFLNSNKQVYIGMAQTLRNRLKTKRWKDFILKDIDLIIIDEAHIQEFNYLFQSDFLKEKFVLGFTATPTRGGKMTQLGIQYDTLIEGVAIKKLVKKEKLVNCDIYDCGSPDMSKVMINKMKGDYAESSMFKKFDSNTLYKGLVKNYLKHTPGQKMIVFCCNVEHAIKTTKELVKAGINAKFVCSQKNPPKEPSKWTQASEALFKERFESYKLYMKNFHLLSDDRKKVFDDFRDGKFEVLVNVDIATKGFDCPDLEVVALYRATTSLALFLQMLGRGARISPGKTHFTVFDFGGNKDRFGPYDLDRSWSLWHDEIKPGAGVPPMKTCGESSDYEEIEGAGDVKKGCKRLILAAYKLCPFCGFKYPQKKEGKEIELELSKITDENGVSITSKSTKEMTHKELYLYRKAKKHHLNWVWFILWNRGKEKEIHEYCKVNNYSRHMAKRAIKTCEEKYNNNK